MTEVAKIQEKSESSVNLDVLDKVKLNPVDGLKFEGKKEETRKQELTITNSSEKEITFKMKGTSPDIVQITPGDGYLQPKAVQNVKVKLKPITENRTNPISREHVTVLLKISSRKRPPNAKDLWRHRSKRAPLRHVVAIKIEGFEGFEPSSKREKSKNKKDKKKSKGKKSKNKIATSDEKVSTKSTASDSTESSSKTDKVV